MASFTLEDIRIAADKKFGNTDILVGEEKVILVNALQLSKLKRDALIATQELLSDESADQAKVLADALRLVIPNTTHADVLLDAVGDNLALLLEIFTSYNTGTQLGEASASDG